jgi:uncharacterized protein YecT (DUF1311 family)
MTIRTLPYLVVLGVVSLFGTPASAYADPVAECQAITSNQVETGQCLQDTLGAVEAVLNLALARAEAKADSIDQVTGRPQARQAVDQSQSLWTNFRAVNCQIPAMFAAGGSGTDQFALACQINMTRLRTVELNTFGD